MHDEQESVEVESNSNEVQKLEGKLPTLWRSFCLSTRADKQLRGRKRTFAIICGLAVLINICLVSDTERGSCEMDVSLLYQVP
jgi:hypothetical protein